MEDRIITMIVNETGHDLVMKVGSRNCFVPLAVVKRSSRHPMELCMNWTYQEFMLEARNLNVDVVGKSKLFVNSDDCCDYERITVKEAEGKFVVERVPRKPLGELGQGFRVGVLSWLKSWLWY